MNGFYSYKRKIRQDLQDYVDLFYLCFRKKQRITNRLRRKRQLPLKYLLENISVTISNRVVTR